MAKKILGFFINLGVFIVSMLIFIFIIELGFVIFKPIPLYGLEPGLLSENPLYEFGLTPNYEGDYNTIDFSLRMEINKLGLKDYRSFDYENYDSAKETILFLGDSFTEGIGVSTENTIPKVFEKHIDSSKYRVINAGVRSYGTKHQYLYLKNEGYKFNPKHIFVIFTQNDVADNFDVVKTYKGYPFPELTLGKKLYTNVFLVLRKFNSFRFLYYDIYYYNMVYKSKKTNFATYDERYLEFSENEEYYDEFEKYALLLKEQADAMGASLTFVFLPWLKSYHYDADYENSRGGIAVSKNAIARLDEIGVDYIDMTEDLKEAQQITNIYFDFDNHYNQKGYTIFGAELAEKFIERNG